MAVWIQIVEWKDVEGSGSDYFPSFAWKNFISAENS
jgi:hypothetical protein